MYRVCEITCYCFPSVDLGSLKLVVVALIQRMNTCSWDVPGDTAKTLNVRAAGAKLLEHLLLMFAEKKLTAKDFPIACHWCAEAEVKGAEFSKYVVPPGQSTGNYQRVVDKVVVPFPYVYPVKTPVMLRNTSRRVTVDIPMNPLHEAIAREIRHDPTIMDRTAHMEWPRTYLEHPLVVEARSSGRPWPLPLAIYIDGVRYTSTLAGRADTIIGVWAYTGVTQKRHYLCSLRTQDLCKCGCRGWCSIAPMMAFLAWSLRALATGQRPALRDGGTRWNHSGPLQELARNIGNILPQVALVWLK